MINSIHCTAQQRDGWELCYLPASIGNGHCFQIRRKQRKRKGSLAFIGHDASRIEDIQWFNSLNTSLKIRAVLKTVRCLLRLSLTLVILHIPENSTGMNGIACFTLLEKSTGLHIATFSEIWGGERCLWLPLPPPPLSISVPASQLE